MEYLNEQVGSYWYHWMLLGWRLVCNFSRCKLVAAVKTCLLALTVRMFDTLQQKEELNLIDLGYMQMLEVCVTLK